MNKLAAIVLLVLVAGCEPASVYRVTSRDADAPWFRGQQLVTREADKVGLTVAFDRSWHGSLIFDVSVVNRSDSTFVVDPADFAFTLETRLSDDSVSSRSDVVAVDPEAVLARIDNAAEAEAASHETSVTLNALSETADLAADVSGGSSRTAEQAREDEHSDRERMAARHEEGEAHAANVTELGRLREYWGSRALRRTTLGPGQTIEGKIAMPAGALKRARVKAQGDREEHPWGLRKPAPKYAFALALRSRIGPATHRMGFVVKEQ
jgi:hypothetical protein